MTEVAVRPRPASSSRSVSGVTVADRLRALNIELPPVFPPAGNYLGCVVDDGLVYVGGHGPIAGRDIVRGKVGASLTLEEGRHAARMTGLSILATLNAVTHYPDFKEGLSLITQDVKGMMNARQ